MSEREDDVPEGGGDAFWPGVAWIAVAVVALAVFLVVVMVATPQV